MSLPRTGIKALAIAWLIAATVAAFGQDYPSRPIRILTVAAGGGGDFTSRLVAQGITGALGQPVIVDNRTALLAVEAVANQPPDGYNIAMVGAVAWVTPLLEKTSYDIVRDLAPVTVVERTIMVLTVNPAVPVRSVKELVDLAKAKPGDLNYGSATLGSNHLAVELFQLMASVKFTRVPYKGASPIANALLANEVQLAIIDSSLVMPHVSSGKLRALAVSSATPTSMVPGVAPIAAAGLPGYEMTPMTVALVNAKTPAPIVNRLNQEMVRAVNQPEIREKFITAGVDPQGTTMDQAATLVKADIARMAKVIKDANLKAN